MPLYHVLCEAHVHADNGSDAFRFVYDMLEGNPVGDVASLNITVFEEPEEDLEEEE